MELLGGSLAMLAFATVAMLGAIQNLGVEVVIPRALGAMAVFFVIGRILGFVGHAVIAEALGNTANERQIVELNPYRLDGPVLQKRREQARRNVVRDEGQKQSLNQTGGQAETGGK